VPWRDGRCGCSGGPARRRRARARWLHCCGGHSSSEDDAAADAFFQQTSRKGEWNQALARVRVAFWAATAILGHRLMRNIGSPLCFGPPVCQEMLSDAKLPLFSVFSALIAAISGHDRLAIKCKSPSASHANPLNPAIASAIAGYFKH